MSGGTGFGHDGAVGEILDVLPLDSTWHVTDCGYDDNDGRCGCYDLPAKLRAIVQAHVTAALTEAADAIELSPTCTCESCDTYRDAARIVRAHIPPP